MSEVLFFAPTTNRSPQEQLAKFVTFCRDQLTVYGSDLPFSDVRWDVSESVDLRALNKRFRLIFEVPSSCGGTEPMKQPFSDFARAYVRYSQGLKPVQDASRRLAAMRVMHDALAEKLKFPCVTRLDPILLGRAATLARERYGAGFAYQVGAALEVAAALIEDLRLTRQPLCRWRNPIAKKKDLRNRVGPEFEKRRSEKLINDDMLAALSRAFELASKPIDLFFTRLSLVMSCAPERINEVLSLPVDCGVDGKDETGRPTYQLRWRGSKGFKDHLKAIPGTMRPFAKEAISTLRTLTDDARRIALWYEANPNKLYLPPALEYLRYKELIDGNELSLITGVDDKSRSDWHVTRRVVPLQTRPGLILRFCDVEQALLKELPNGFPIFDKRSGLKFSEALCVVPKNFTRCERSDSPCMIAAVSINQVNQQLGSAIKHGKSSVFSRAGITLRHGSDVSLTTGVFRHTLNTMAQASGLEQVQIALWSGRAEPAQNASYDHVPAEDLLREVDVLFDLDEESISRTPVAVRNPLTFQQMRALDVTAAHTTDMGACVSDFVLQPCQLQLDCANCGDHIYIKDHSGRDERLRLRLELHEGLLQKAKEANAIGTLGADRWFEHQDLVVNRLRALLEIIDDPSVAVGTMIRLSKDGVAVLIESPASVGAPLVLRAISSQPAVRELLDQAAELLPRESAA